jgi:hypothetical protein
VNSGGGGGGLVPHAVLAMMMMLRLLTTTSTTVTMPRQQLGWSRDELVMKAKDIVSTPFDVVTTAIVDHSCSRCGTDCTDDCNDDDGDAGNV